jgi:hypothetical protein
MSEQCGPENTETRPLQRDQVEKANTQGTIAKNSLSQIKPVQKNQVQKPPTQGTKPRTSLCRVEEPRTNKYRITQRRGP